MSTILEVSNEILQEKNEKIIPENIKKGIKIFDIEGALEAGAATEGVKLFSTVEEMNADTTAEVGDLALVYKDATGNATVNSRFSKAIFPNTVKLSTAVSDYIEIMYRAVDSSIMFECWGQLDSNRFMMECYTDSSNIRIQYESSDGINYSRTDGGEEEVDFGVEIYYYYAEYWNDAIGYFIKTGTKEFEGLYERIEILNKEFIRFADLRNMTFNIENDAISSWNWDGTFIPGHYDLNKINTLINQYQIDKGYGVYSINNIGLYLNTEGKVFFIVNPDRNNNFNNASLAGDMNGNIIGLCIYKTTTPSMVTLDLDNMTYTEEVLSLDSSKSHKTYFRTYYLIDILPISYPPRFYPSTSDAGHLAMTIDAYYSTWNGAEGDENETAAPYNVNECYKKEYLYTLAPTQFNATSDIVYGGIFYGKNGVEEGTLGVEVSTEMNDFSAEVTAKSMVAYSNLEDIVLTDDNKTLPSNMRIAPVRLDGTSLVNTSSLTNFSSLFRDQANLYAISNLNTSKAVDITNMFYNCTQLTSIPNLDTKQVINAAGAFRKCSSVTSLPEFNFNNLTFAHCIFEDCTNITSIPNYNFSKVTNMCRAFYGCTNLTTVPKFNVASNPSLKQAFQMCTNLTTVPNLKSNDYSFMCSGCENLTDIPQLDVSLIGNNGLSCIAGRCNNLTNASIQNIINMCLNSGITGVSYTNLNVGNYYSPLSNTKFNSSYYSNRLSELSAAGWSY